MEEIDISNPPSFDVAPVDAYQDVMPDDDEFSLDAFDIGVIVDKVYNHVPAPKPFTPPKPRAKKVTAIHRQEMVGEFVQIPEALTNTVIGRIAGILAHCIEFPEASTFLSMLASASASVTCNYAVQYSNEHSISTGIYLIAEQPPATQKTRILDAGTVPYEIAMTAHNKKVFARLREESERDMDSGESVKPGFVLTTDPTSASMDKFMHGCSEGRFVVASAEQSALTSLFPESGSFASTNELILKGYAGEFVAGMRSGRMAFSGIANGTVVLIAQNGASKRVLAASNNSGMAERFCFIAEPTLLGSRTFNNGNVKPSDKSQFDLAVNKCVDAYSAKILSYKNSDLETRVVLDPKNLEQLRASHLGYQMIRQWKVDNESRLGALQESGDMVMLSWLGKFETHVLKFAAVTHVFECLGNGVSVPAVIPDKIISASMDLAETLSFHMEGLIQDLGESGADAEEQAVIEALSGKRLAVRALTQALRHRKPYKSMGKTGYQSCIRRVEKMIEAGQLVIKADGTLEIV